MPFGILDVKGPVPGTVTILQDQRTPSAASSLQSTDPSLKYDRSGPFPILLVPQPADDPNDPLNQPLWKRDVQLVALSLLSVIATTLSPILAANSLGLVAYFHRSIAPIALLTGWHLLGVGLAAIISVPLACVWGKRHLYLAGSLIVCASCAWGGAVGHSYTSLVWARVFQGVGLAPFESLLNASVADLFFVHERGKRMALANLALFGGAFLAPVIVGQITSTLGWPWTFNLVAILSGALLPVIFFFAPETAYVRRTAEPSRAEWIHESSQAYELSETTVATKGPTHTAITTSSKNVSPTHSQVVPPKVSYMRSLAPFNGRKTNVSFFKLLLRPFPLFTQPAILWACLTQGTLIGWTVFIGIVLAAILGLPPLFFDPVHVGYMYGAAFIGALVGYAVAGLVADSSAKYLTRRNGGIYEPEFRLILVVPMLVFASIGLYGFGITSSNIAVYRWVGPAVFFGFEVAGMVCGAVAAGLYLADAYPQITVETFTACIVFKNLFSFGLTYHGYDWLIKVGIQRMFNIVASVQVGVCLLSILMYVFGKRLRHFYARHDLLRALR